MNIGRKWTVSSNRHLSFCFKVWHSRKIQTEPFFHLIMYTIYDNRGQTHTVWVQSHNCRAKIVLCSSQARSVHVVLEAPLNVGIAYTLKKKRKKNRIVQTFLSTAFFLSFSEEVCDVGSPVLASFPFAPLTPLQRSLQRAVQERKGQRWR